jgi:hypothetical protein
MGDNGFRDGICSDSRLEILILRGVNGTPAATCGTTAALVALAASAVLLLDSAGAINELVTSLVAMSGRVLALANCWLTTLFIVAVEVDGAAMELLSSTREALWGVVMVDGEGPSTVTAEVEVTEVLAASWEDSSETV